MDQPAPTESRFPWGWAVFALALIGQCWLPFWLAVSDSVCRFLALYKHSNSGEFHG